jgi:hypothetical protein
MYRKARFQRLLALFVGTKAEAVQNFDFKNVIFGNFLNGVLGPSNNNYMFSDMKFCKIIFNYTLRESG